jgi:glucuronokinase
MQTLHHNAHARAGLLGNPSDGYHGKTISVSVPAFAATVTLYEWETLEIIASREDRSRFGSVLELAQDVELHGYYGGIRLVKATIKKFVEFCNGKHTLHDRNFSIRYNSDIPRAVGLAGSSAIIVATLRALMNFYEVGIPLEVQPSLVLSVEKDELSIQGGLQDRVIQVYDGLVYMDFSEQASTNQQGLCCGTYERLSTKNLPPLFLAYDATVGEPTEVFHNRLRERFAQEGRGVIQENNWARLNELIDENFDLRNSICQLPTAQVDMITRARKVGASAKFAGSGGAIIGIYQDDSMFDQLQLTLNQIGCDILKV